MTTTTISTVRPRGDSLGRIAAVVKLHFTNPWTSIYMPWLIMAAIFVLNVVVWWLISIGVDSEADRVGVLASMRYSGAATYFFVYMMVVAVQSINSYFPFALGYGATRRNYYLGASVSFVLLSVLYTAALSLLALAEEATGGWGFGGTIFTVEYFGAGAGQRLFVFLAGFLFFFFVGAAVASVYVRWKVTGMITFFIALAFLLVGAAAVITFTVGWTEIGAWLTTNGVVGVVTLSMLPTTVAAVTGYLILRKATPRT